MKVLVDTSIWSLAFRKKVKAENENQIINVLENLIYSDRIAMIGPIRQEILSGLKSEIVFEKLSNTLKIFADLLLTSEIYINAAKNFNICRANGVQGSHIDFLICAVAQHYKIPIFTLDKDFELYSKYIDIEFFLQNT